VNVDEKMGRMDSNESNPSASTFSGNIQVVPLNELTEEVDGRTDVPSEVSFVYSFKSR